MKKSLYLIIGIVLIGIVAVLAIDFTKPKPADHLNVRLQWFPQAQFAGYLVAEKLGYYEEEGITITILPAGPDLKPHMTVANGSDDIGIGVSNQIIAAQSNGVPLVTIAQIFQDSPNRYVLKKENAITSLSDLKGKNVGLWLGGDEAEFVSMLKTANMTLNDVNVISQGFTIVPFLENQYALSQVTSYNELQQIRSQISDNNLQVLSPGDYNSAIPADNIFTRQDLIDSNPEILIKFLKASIRGWKYAMEHPEETLDIIVSYNPELEKGEQRTSLKAVLELVMSGEAKTEGIGYMNAASYENVKRILMESGQIEKEVEVKNTFNTELWSLVPVSVRKF